MSKTSLLFLDGFFFAFHTALVAFNVLGWTWRKTRRANLVCLLVTAVSWFVMGLWKGVGYCILTDWHWQVRRALGIKDPDQSYIELLVRKLTGWAAPPSLIQAVCGIAFASCIGLSVFLNVRDLRQANPNPK